MDREQTPTITISKPIDPVPEVEPAASSTTDRLGRFSLLERIGGTPRSTSWVAFDNDAGRRVGLEVMEVPDSSVRYRLVRELEELARIAHRHVVQIHGVEQLGRRVILVREHVMAQGLRSWLEAQPSTSRILTLFIDAARGAAAVHRAGLVHGDIKPGSILVAEGNVAKLTDFAPVRLARAELRKSRVSHSSSGDRRANLRPIGTPVYMAPEQFLGGRVDHRTEQYSLCVALYEALTGVRPTAASARLRNKPLDPEHAQIRLPKWLRAVLERALAIRPEERWPSMDALIDQLCADPAIKRRRMIAAVPVLAASFGLAAAVLSEEKADACASWASELEANWASEAGRVEQAFQGTGAPYADGIWNHTRESLERYADEWGEIRAGICRAEHAHGLSTVRARDRSACMDEARDTFSLVVEALAQADETSILRSRAMLDVLPDPRRCQDDRVGSSTSAHPHGAEEGDDVGSSLGLALSRATLERAAGRAGRASEILDEIETPELGRAERARVHALRAELARDRGDLQEARVRILESYFEAAHEGVWELQASSAASLAELHAQTDDDDARLWLRHARVALGSHESASLEVRLALVEARLEERQRRWDAARESSAHAFETATRSLGEAHPLTLRAGWNVADLAAASGHHELALEGYERTLNLYEEHVDPEHPSIVSLHRAIAGVYASSRRPRLARVHARRALELGRATLGDRHPTVLAVLSDLGAILARIGDSDGALEVFRELVESSTRVYGALHPHTIAARVEMARALRSEGRLQEALDEHRRCRELWMELHGGAHLDGAMARSEAAAVLLEQGKIAQALDEQVKAREEAEALVDDDPASLVPFLRFEARALAACERFADARSEYMKVLEMLPVDAAEARISATVELGQVELRIPAHRDDGMRRLNATLESITDAQLPPNREIDLRTEIRRALRSSTRE